MKKLFSVSHITNDKGEVAYHITLDLYLESDKMADISTVLVNLTRCVGITESELSTMNRSRVKDGE